MSIRTEMRLALLASTLLLLAGAATQAATDPAEEELDPEKLVLTFHKITGKPFDFERHINFAPGLSGPPTFDRPDIIKEERARLQGLLDAGNSQIEFTTTVSDYFAQYDHERGEFPINLFQPGIYLQYKYHYDNYSLVFANAGAAAALKMPKEQARAFDQQLQARGRNVSTVVRFRLIGAGDPQGAVTGDRVMLAELVSVKVLDRNGNVVYAPDITPAAEIPAPVYVASQIDVAGMRVGVDADQFKAALERLYSAKVERFEAARNGNVDRRYAGYLEIDLLTCMGGGYRRRAPAPGDVCLRAYYDEDEVIRTIVVVRVFPWMQFEDIRKAAIARYGTVSWSSGGGAYMAWGPAVDPALLSYKGPQSGYALTMNVDSPSDLLGQSLNSRPRVNIALQLTDAEWAARAKPLRQEKRP